MTVIVNPESTIYMVHYVQNGPMKGRTPDEFCRLLDNLSGDFHLTFDDGLKDHYTTVLPILEERGLTGTFFIPTSAIERVILPTHQNHLLLAYLPFDTYLSEWTSRLPIISAWDSVLPEGLYPWDRPQVAYLKYVLSRVVDPSVRDPIQQEIFNKYLNLSPNDVYMTWDQIRELEAAGMTIGGHSHFHRLMTSYDEATLQDDVETCWALLGRRNDRPFCYPFGREDSISPSVIATVEQYFSAGYTAIPGKAGNDPYRLHRIDLR